MKYIILLAALLMPFSLCAKYNPDQIKKSIIEEKIFEAKSWADVGGGMWTLDSTVSGMKVIVLKQNAALSMRIQNESQLDGTFQRCEKLAIIGLAPPSDAKKAEIKKLVRSVIKNGDPKKIELNDVIFEVEFGTIKRRKRDVFGCSLSEKLE